jgi:hypothetical protein
MSEEKKPGIFKKVFFYGRVLIASFLLLMVGAFIATVAYGIKAQCPDIPPAVGLFVVC